MDCLRTLKPDSERAASNHPSNSQTLSGQSLQQCESSSCSVRLAIVSFLFNWPSTGGGNIHTVELAEFLSRAGYEVRLFCPRYAPWMIGQVDRTCPFPVEKIPFSEAEWQLDRVLSKIKQSVDTFAPETVLITDSWNMKPHLFHALKQYRVLLRMQAEECLCPLNNLRLLGDPHQGFHQCPCNQLAAPETCRTCLETNGHTSGSLHLVERVFCGVGSEDYQQKLTTAFRDADSVLALNPTLAETLKPHCNRVEVVTWGMDPTRFDLKEELPDSLLPDDGKVRLLFAGLTAETIKGSHVLREACRRLWQQRHDFELVLTDEVPEVVEPYERYVGWQTQRDLPRWYQATDITIVPTITADGLSRTSVEAMACGKPVVASRIGGIPFSVIDDETGLLFAPGDSEDLARKLTHLLDDPDLRARLGTNGRAVFENRFTWERVIETQYRPLIKSLPSKKRTEPGKTAFSLTGGRRLEIGPGTIPLSGFETVDVVGQPTYRADWGTDRLTDIIPAGSCREIYASHVLEHIPWNRTQGALRDVYELLEPGGLLEIWVPDFEYIVACYQRRVCGDSWRRDNPQGDPLLWVNGRIFTYGPGEENRHRACFDYEHLSHCLSLAGFVEIERLSERTRGESHGPIDLGVRCHRPRE
ncbi:MAG: hypothetical protein Tsb009_36320 [Planctomycetaceae bacterium]